jgi:hypothetical protein
MNDSRADKKLTPKQARFVDKRLIGESPAHNRRSIDWDAVERDYRTTAMTDGELSTKHGVTREAIVRRRTRESAADSSRWQRDLSAEVRAATNALLLRETITQQITDGHRQITDAVMSAAEVNRAVIMGHRSELQEARTLAMSLLAEVRESAMLAADKDLLAQVLAGSGATPTDEAQARRAVQRALETGSRVASAKLLADTLTKLHVGERTAFGLEDTAPANPLESMSDEALAAERARLSGE